MFFLHPRITPFSLRKMLGIRLECSGHSIGFSMLSVSNGIWLAYIQHQSVFHRVNWMNPVVLNLSLHQNHLEGQLKHPFLGPTHQSF